MTDYKQILVREAGLSTMLTNCLASGGGFYRMGELEEATAAELLRIPNLGRKSVCELVDWFAERGALAGERRQDAMRQLQAMRERARVLRSQADQTDGHIADLVRRLGDGDA